MSLELVDRILRGWEDPEYKGNNERLSAPFVENSVDMRLINRIMVDSHNGKYLKPSLKKLDDYEPTRNGLLQFYDDRNFKIVRHDRVQILAYRIPAPTPMEEIYFLEQYFKNAKYILELGFFGGYNTVEYLNRSNAYIITFDNLVRDFSWYSKNFIESKFQNRHLLLNGRLSQSHKILDITMPDIKFDYIYMRKSVRYQTIYSYFINFRKYAHEDTIIFLHGVNPDRVWGIGPYVAMLKLLNEGVITFVDMFQYKPESYLTTNLAILKYNFTSGYMQKVNPKVYIKFEKDMPMNEFYIFVTNDIEGNTNLVTKELVAKYKRKFAKFGLIFDEGLKKLLKEKYDIDSDAL